jgi:hypothetical protein
MLSLSSVPEVEARREEEEAVFVGGWDGERRLRLHNLHNKDYWRDPAARNINVLVCRVGEEGRVGSGE